MKRKSYLLLALILVLVLSGGIYAYTFTTTTGTIAIATPTGDIATVNATGPAPNWNSLLPYSATEILRPIAAGDTTLITSQNPVTGAHWDKVDETTPDGDTTSLYTTNWDWLEDLYHIADTSVGSGDINYVKVYWVGKISTTTPTTTAARPHVKTYGTTYIGPEEQMTTSYATYSYQWNINPNTGTAWTWAEVNALQVGLALRRPRVGQETRITQVYAEVSYSVISGAVPTGNLYNITRNSGYSGDLSVKVYHAIIKTGIKKINIL